MFNVNTFYDYCNDYYDYLCHICADAATAVVSDTVTEERKWGQDRKGHDWLEPNHILLTIKGGEGKGLEVRGKKLPQSVGKRKERKERKKKGFQTLL